MNYKTSRSFQRGGTNQNKYKNAFNRETMEDFMYISNYMIMETIQKKKKIKEYEEQETRRRSNEKQA